MKNPKKLLFAIIAIVIVIAVIIAYYGLKINTARCIFDKKIDEFLSSNEENTDYNTIKVNADFEMSIDSKESEVEEVADFLKDAKFSFNTEIDKEKQEEIVGIKMTKADEELINANVKLETGTQNMYVNLGELFKKTIQFDISEIADETVEIADTNVMSFSQQVNSKKAQTILKKEVKSQLKDEYFSAEKATIDEEKVTKNQLKVPAKEFVNMMKNIYQNLSENEEYIDCFEDGEKVKKALQEGAEQLGEIDSDEMEDVNLEINVYTKGIAKNIKRVDLVAEEDDERATIEIKKLSDEEYEYKVLDNDDEAFNGTLKIKNEDNHFEFEISAKADETEIKLKSTGNVAYDEELSSFDTENVVNYQELTTEDIYELAGNFMQSKLYQIVEEVSNTKATTLDKDYDDDQKEDDNNNKTSKLEDNVVKTYDDASIKFNIADGFEIYSSDNEHYKLFEKEVNDESTQVDVSTEYSTLDEYIEEVKEKEEYYKEDDDYKNVKVSDVEEIKVNGNTFKKITISYDYSFSSDDEDVISHSEAYFAHEVDKDNLYVVEIDGVNLIDDKDIETFLTIEK